MVMSLRNWSVAGITILAVALVLALPGRSQAQRTVLGGNYPGAAAQPSYGGYAQPYYNSYGPSYAGASAPSFVSGYTPMQYGAYVPSWGYPYQPYSFYSVFGPTNSPNFFYEPWGYPSLSVNMAYYNQLYGSPPFYSAAAQRYGTNFAAYNGNTARQSFYPAADTRQPPANTAGVEITVMPNAEIWFDGTKTSQVGAVRKFRTPTLEPGGTYTYTIRARWMQNGEVQDVTRDLRVQANKQAYLDFTVPAPSK
jgi:uncharacterized protein (TIGR03000 family)